MIFRYMLRTPVSFECVFEFRATLWNDGKRLKTALYHTVVDFAISSIDPDFQRFIVTENKENEQNERRGVVFTWR